MIPSENDSCAWRANMKMSEHDDAKSAGRRSVGASGWDYATNAYQWSHGSSATLSDRVASQQ